jgi:hypothetical protein
MSANAGSAARNPSSALTRACNEALVGVIGRLDTRQQPRGHLVVGGEERVVFILEVVVERAPRDAGGDHDVLDAHRRVARGAAHLGDGDDDPLALVGRYELRRQPVASRGKLAGLPCILLAGCSHKGNIAVPNAFVCSAGEK